MKSEAVLKASKMHDELDLDGRVFCRSPLPRHPLPMLL